jgi:adenylate kinase family enzyme
LVNPGIVHVIGASGSGTTTLGMALATSLGRLHLDTDDFYWVPTDPPYRETRPIEQRLALMQAAVTASGAAGCVVSGSLDDWGDRLVPQLRLVTFLRVPTDVRIARLKAREAQRFGAAIEPGGERYEEYQAFIAWAAEYESGALPGRNLRRHEAWLADLPCPVLRLDGTQPTNVLVDAVRQYTSPHSMARGRQAKLAG